MYTLGGLMVSSDDDMRPWCLMQDHPESLAEDEVSRGRLVKAGRNGYTRKSFDILASFLDVLGKPRGDALRLFAANLARAFYGFEPDFFQQNLLRIVDDVISA